MWRVVCIVESMSTQKVVSKTEYEKKADETVALGKLATEFMFVNFPTGPLRDMLQELYVVGMTLSVFEHNNGFSALSDRLQKLVCDIIDTFEESNGQVYTGFQSGLREIAAANRTCGRDSCGC